MSSMTQLLQLVPEGWCIVGQDGQWVLYDSDGCEVCQAENAELMLTLVKRVVKMTKEYAVHQVSKAVSRRHGPAEA